MYVTKSKSIISMYIERLIYMIHDYNLQQIYIFIRGRPILYACIRKSFSYSFDIYCMYIQTCITFAT